MGAVSHDTQYISVATVNEDPNLPCERSGFPPALWGRCAQNRDPPGNREPRRRLATRWEPHFYPFTHVLGPHTGRDRN